MSQLACTIPGCVCLAFAGETNCAVHRGRMRYDVDTGVVCAGCFKRFRKGDWQRLDKGRLVHAKVCEVA